MTIGLDIDYSLNCIGDAVLVSGTMLIDESEVLYFIRNLSAVCVTLGSLQSVFDFESRGPDRAVGDQ